MSSGGRTSGWAALWFCVLFIAYIKYIVAIALFVLGVWILTKVTDAWRRDRAARQAEAEAYALRAEAENRAYLRAGIYEGNYPAATLPMTRGL